MPVIAVVNRKGGSGKTTLATHIAAWCAQAGLSVMLGDVDRQQSTRGWLRLRSPHMPAIAPWAMDHKNVLRVPSGISHVVLDTPGGLHGFELARIVMFADAVLMPVCHSVFDRESAALCLEELRTLPRVARGRCRVAAVGMRVDGRTRAAQRLEAWADGIGLQFLGALRDTQNYVHSAERGLTVFDLPARLAATDHAQWEPVLNWLRPIVHPLAAANDTQLAAGVASTAARLAPSRHSPGMPPARPHALMPQQESLVAGTRLAASSGRLAEAVRQPVAPRPSVLAQSAPAARSGRIDGPQIPQFLKKAV